MAMTHQGYETRHRGCDGLATHRHRGAYAALVLDGAHVESSVDGPVACEPGILLLHPRFHAHGNRFAASGARVLNLALPDALAPDRLLAFRTPDPTAAQSVLRHGDLPALQELVAASQLVEAAPGGWESALLDALRDSEEPIAVLATRIGVSPAHASRAMRRTHGMGPQQLRRELRWRHALALLHGDAPLAEIAAQAGFSDQSHLTRVAVACSGVPPARLRRQVKCVQDPPAARMLQSA